MKTSLLSSLCFGLFLTAAEASTYSFLPSPSDLNDLDHNRFFTWGLNWNVPQGEKMIGAQLSFSQIWDWRVEPDTLFIHLLDTAPLGVNAWVDNEGGGDFFASSLFNSLGIAHLKLAEWSDPNGGDPNKAQNVTFNFNAAQLAVLQSYINTAGSAGWARFGFGLDPDCHYFNNGVSFNIITQRPPVPEGGSTVLLLALGFAGIALRRRKLRA
jgi:hypothetical protein